ncbi:MAG: DNA-binding response regulator [Cytophagales bacterium]|nr:MAG: DNA-binding response regulator [Cytophagales bacterium]
MNKIKLLITDDHQVIRRGIATLLEDELDINIVGEASDGIEALEKIKNLVPDIILLDISMPKMGGIETAQMIIKNKLNVKIIIFSMHNSEDYILKSIESGASGYVLKDTTKEELLFAIKKVHEGEKYFNTKISEIIINSISNKSKISTILKIDKKLTKSEKVVLKQIVNGLSSREIAEKLTLSVRTVDNHRAHIMKKSGVKNTAELVKIALNENLV